MLERLWSGWRAAYVAELAETRGVPRGAGSIFTQILNSGLVDEETHIVHRGETCFVIMNIFPYTSGHLLVLPYREVAELADLHADETGELWATVSEAVQAIREAYHPDGLNIGLNLGRPAGGSVADHLHVHVVPRWTGDSNFMTAISNTQTLPESLDESARKIRGAWRGVSEH